MAGLVGTPSEYIHWGHILRTPLYLSVSPSLLHRLQHWRFLPPQQKLHDHCTPRHSQCLGPLTYHTLVDSPQQQLSHPIQRKEPSASHAPLNINILHHLNKLLSFNAHGHLNTKSCPSPYREEGTPAPIHHTSISYIINEASDQHHKLPYPLVHYALVHFSCPSH